MLYKERLITFVEFGGGQSSQVVIRNDGMGWDGLTNRLSSEWN